MIKIVTIIFLTVIVWQNFDAVWFWNATKVEYTHQGKNVDGFFVERSNGKKYEWFPWDFDSYFKPEFYTVTKCENAFDLWKKSHKDVSDEDLKDFKPCNCDK